MTDPDAVSSIGEGSGGYYLERRLPWGAMADIIMANRRIAMRKIRQVLRLAFEAGASRRLIAKSLGLSRDAVTDYLTRAAAAGLSWPLPVDLDDAQLEARLFPPLDSNDLRKPEPDWAVIHREMRRKDATLQALHGEFLAEQPNGIGYSLFCQRYREWLKGLKRYMRQTHVAGERAFVDYAGPRVGILNRETGEIRMAQIFVGILGASSYTYAEAHWSQQLPDWIAAHTRMFEFFGGVPQIVVCDNLKSAVTKASRTDPKIHPAYQHLAEHYNTLILPARPYKPKDKAKVENAVLIVERWILFRLRKRIFTSLAELNAAIQELLADLNNRPFQKLPGSRRGQFEAIERPALMPLPSDKFEYTEFRKVTIGLDGCFEVDGCIYSAPYTLCRKPVELRITANLIEILHRGRRVASHERTSGKASVIDSQHLHPAARHFGMWSADRELAWAASIGPKTHAFLSQLLAASKVKEQGYRSAGALKRLEKEFGAERLEAACARAFDIGARSLGSVRSILNTGLDRQRSPEADFREAAFHHPNVRGSEYYH